MSAVNFPSSPSNGATFSAGEKTYQYNSTKGVWNILSGGGSEITVSQNGSNDIVSNTINFINTSSVTVETSNNNGVINVAFTSAGSGGITTGKAIAMSIVFGG